MTGQITFVISILLICIPRCIFVLHALLTGQPWFYSAIGAGIALNLAYCAWRGERWAYYLLIFLSALGLLLSGILLVTTSSFGELLLLILSLVAIFSGLVLLVVHPGSKAFMDEQRTRFGGIHTGDN